PQMERANYLNRLRKEEPSLYSQVDSFHQMVGEDQGAKLCETLPYPSDAGELPTDGPPDSQPTSPVESTSVDRLCDEFAAALVRRETPKIEDFLARGHESDEDELLERLILLEVQNGLSEHVANLDEYAARFPEKPSVVSQAFLQFQEWSLVQSDDTTRVGEWPDQKEGTVRVRPEEVVPPKAVFGDYEILEEIARGGMGIVLKARQRSLNRVVALKMIRNGTLADQEEVLRFRAEAEAAAKLNHQQIVPVYEVGEHDGQHYFTMALIEGESLSVRLRKGPLVPREAARILSLVAAGVQYAHEQGVVHRDLKPGNILLNADNQPKVADFGLAKQLDQDSNLTVTGCVLGTPSFMPPEQACGEEAGPHSDIYSLGAILYTMLTNRPPFQAANATETIQQVKEKDPVPPRQLNPAINQDLQTICLKCLE
ncbi:MAG: serine/threonine protein kinase, partial [Planctomycetaceae bacterium]|nr:serine/threonine protein kinase [Planctomycetaceae bacterium]